MQLINVNDVYALFNKDGTAKLHVADIDQLPRVIITNDAVRAKWIDKSFKMYGGVVSYYICSQCEHESNIRTNFCSSCGAKMDLEE